MSCYSIIKSTKGRIKRREWRMKRMNFSHLWSQLHKQPAWPLWHFWHHWFPFGQPFFPLNVQFADFKNIYKWAAVVKVSAAYLYLQHQCSQPTHEPKLQAMNIYILTSLLLNTKTVNSVTRFHRSSMKSDTGNGQWYLPHQQLGNMVLILGNRNLRSPSDYGESTRI